MKKVVFLFAALLLIAALAPGVWAVEMIPYHTQGIYICIPESYSVLIREMKLSEETMRFMIEGNVYLDAMNEEEDQGICIYMKDMEVDSMQGLDDEEIEEWIPYFEEQSEEFGDTVEGSGTYPHSQTTFHKMRLHFSNANGVQYVIQYNTIIFGKWICIEAHSGAGPISAEQESEWEKVIDSIYFRRRFFVEPAGHSDAFQYVDPMTGAEFTVPEGWSTESSEENEYPHTTVYLNEDPNVAVLYGVVDLWEKVPQGQRAGKTRASMENPLFGPGGLASELGIPSNEVSRKRYGEMEYAVGKRVEEAPNGDGEMEPAGHTTVMAGFDHGYAYYFFFPGWEDHENYRDLEAMAASMKYPEYPDSAPGSALWKNFLIAGAVLALVGIWIALRGRRERKRLAREGVVSEAYPEELRDTRRPKQSTESGRPKNCRFCGARLPEKGEFCPECGTRIEE